MLRLNRLTDYAVVVLAQMAAQPERLRTAQQIAQDTAVPLPTVAKILNALARASVITSLRGAAGGYRLARPAEQVSIFEVVQALEGPIALTACVDGSEDSCEVESLCPMRGNWERVNDAIRTALQGVTLADMSIGALPFAVDEKANNQADKRDEGAMAL